MKVRQLLSAVMLLTIPLMGCTNSQIAEWITWYQTEPDAAMEFANLPAVQEALASRDSRENNSRQTSSTNVWDSVAQCESGGNWAINTGNGYSGGLQFLHSSWRGYGGTEFAPLAYQASREQQIIVAERILKDAGWRAWPACSRKLGLR